MQLKKADKLSKSRLRSLREEANKTLQTIFTENQIKILTGKQKYVHWTNDEISNAFTLRYLSRKAYIFVRNKLQYPLPGVSSLRRWARTIEMRHGLLSSILRIMEVAGENLDNFQRLTVLSFDEIKVEKTLEYDAINDEIVGPFSQMQIVMARGLNSK
ncbi:uncharacterized protein LOC118181783 [Stegodyphus dumicola]|uniref:uncharacterized protein LOC118181783 n=1 Tax=Stegodyphus dumicola TaxID=202533 RepID=UPI0015B1C029|nr:uncharacterized protein LOC118181783 [Stegodyphus dumicola]